MNLDINKTKLPTKIDPCPIVEAIIEIRFDSDFPHDAIFGILFKEFKNDFPDVEELPILQLPEFVRKQDPVLKYKPYYKLKSADKFIFQIGARLISLINLEPYCGWEIFSSKIKDLITRTNGLGLINSITRLGIRYVNGFDFNVLEKINLAIKIDGSSLIELDSTIKMEIPTGKFLSTLRVANNANVTKKDAVVKGSVIDIDTYIENPDEPITDLIEQGHSEEKKLFFTLLKEDYIKILSPEY